MTGSAGASWNRQAVWSLPVLSCKTVRANDRLSSTMVMTAVVARFYPAAHVVAAERADAGACCSVEADGQRPPQLNDLVTEQMIEILDLQASLFPPLPADGAVAVRQLAVDDRRAGEVAGLRTSVNSLSACADKRALSA